MFRAATSCAVVVVLALTTLVVPSASAQEDFTEGLRVDSRQFVEVDLQTASLRVRHEIDLRNETPNRTVGGFVEQYYFQAFTVPVYRGASAMAATRSDGRRLPVSIDQEPDGVVSFATIDLQPNIYYGETASIVLTYELRTQPPRSGGLAQINAALATFPLVLSGDPGLADVEVRIPSGEEIEVVGDPLDRREEDGIVVLSAIDVADPAAWFSTVLVRNDEALVQRDVTYGNHTIRLQGWPGDDEWMTTTEDLAVRGLPALEGVIGYGWDGTRHVDIVETVAPYVYGFAGWYQPTGANAVIEVGDRLDPHVTMHELAHSWFDSSTFEARWLNEALADETAALAMAALGMERPLPEPASVDQPGAIALADWAHPDLANPESDDQEAYGYNTSWWIAHQLSQEIGQDALRDVLVAANQGRSAYDIDDDGADALDIGTVDWREMLDLAEDIGGSQQAAGLWQTFVLTPDQAAELANRNTARDEYRRLVEVGDGWLPPRVLRDEMARWDFDDAAELSGEVHELYDRRDELDERYDDLGIGLPASLEEEFEDAADLAEIDARFDTVDDAIDAVEEADEALDDLGLVAQVGLWFEDPSSEVDDATAALAAGAYSQAETHAASASDAAENATRDGAIRLAGLTGVVLLAGYGIHRLRVHRRRPESF